jgi:hypothetical protein
MGSLTSVNHVMVGAGACAHVWQVLFSNNTIYVPGAACTITGAPFTTYAEMQAKGYELVNSTLIATLPSTPTIIGWARDLLSMAEADARRPALARTTCASCARQE